MSFLSDVQAKLVEVHGAIVGYAVRPQETSLPYVVWRIGGAEHDHLASGKGGMVTYDIYVDHYAHTATQLWSLSEASRLALDGLAGLIGGTTVLNSELTYEDSETAWESEGSDSQCLWYTHEYSILVTETVG